MFILVLVTDILLGFCKGSGWEGNIELQQAGLPKLLAVWKFRAIISFNFPHHWTTLAVQ